MTFTPRTETYVNVSSLTTPFNITVTKPTGTVNGDILFCWIGWYAAVTIDSVPSGWNLLGEYLVNTDRYALYYKIASSEGASWVWSFTATAKVRAVCSCYTAGNFDSANPINVVSNTAYRTSDANCIAATMTVAAVSSPLIFWGGFYNTSTGSFTKPSVPTSGWVEDDDVWNTTPDFGTEVCSFIWGGSGATGAMSATITLSLVTKHAFAVALNPPVAKAFADVGHGVEGFINPFRAMPFAETGHGAEGFVNPYRAMGFSDVGHGSELFQIVLKALGFSDIGVGSDAFTLFLEKAFADAGYGTDAFTKIITFLTKTFGDTGYGIDVFVTPFRALGFADVGYGSDAFVNPFRAVIFTESGQGVDAFVIPFKSLSFMDVGGGSDSFSKLVTFLTKAFSDSGGGSDGFATPFRAMSFSDVGYGGDAFIIVFKGLQFADAGLGIDLFSAEELGAFITKAFNDVAAGIDFFATPFRAVMFADNGQGVDVFLIPFKALSFADVGVGLDAFSAYVLITKSFIDAGAGLDAFSKKEGFTVGLPMILITTSGGILVNVGKKTVFISEDLKVKMGDMVLQELT